jgi:threonine aldolase
MIRFDNDYVAGGHTAILDALYKTNEEQLPGYGTDKYTESAQTFIKQACDTDDIDVHLMVGGTQANTTIIASILRPHQAVISADTGHIAVHETGAIEATGHKVIELTNDNGKLSAAQISQYVADYWDDATHEHIPQPKLVYLSQPTELGSLYSKQELTDIYNVCKSNNLYLMVDGARLGYGLASDSNDLTLNDLTKLTDVFYIGGTKVGALFGEAIVITHNDLKQDFRYMMKQHGGLLAKGRLLGIQFTTLFQDNLYIQLGRHALDMANLLKAELQQKGITMQYDSPTNQLFPIISRQQMETLSKDFAFQIWEKLSAEKIVIRLCTSWSTKKEDVQKLINAI